MIINVFMMVIDFSSDEYHYDDDFLMSSLKFIHAKNIIIWFDFYVINFYQKSIISIIFISCVLYSFDQFFYHAL